MPVTLIKENEKLSIEIDGSTFYYRRIRDVDFANIRRKHTKRGEVDNMAVGLEVLENYVVGWDGVTDPDGNEVPFSRELIADLPSVIQVQLLNRINADTTGVNVTKKLKTTPTP